MNRTRWDVAVSSGCVAAALWASPVHAQTAPGVGEPAACAEPAISGPGPSPISRAVFERLGDRHRTMIENLLERPAPGHPLAAACFDEGADPEVVGAFASLLNADNRYYQIPRWNVLATFGGTGQQGDPIVITYSFVPDGTEVFDGIGEGVGFSNLFKYLNGIYGTTDAWQAVYASVFARWSELSGITFIFEPVDDGSEVNRDNSGARGIRGDIRMTGKFIDGSRGVLAYNYFPDVGDMVVDTGDDFYFDTSLNSRRLRNVLAHEFGHGMGQLHVCPVQRTKLMEPFVTTQYDGPRHDDIRNAQNHYGDVFEPDNTPAQATDLGAFTPGQSLVIGPPPPPDLDFGSIISIDADGEQDYFRLRVDEALSLTVMATPIGLIYDDSPQNCSGFPGFCCQGSFTSSQALARLGIEVVREATGAVLGVGKAEPNGIPQSVTVDLPAPGAYLVRVFEQSAQTSAQLYHLSVSAAIATIQMELGVYPPTPTIIPPGQALGVQADIAPGTEGLVPGTALLRYRVDAGAEQSLALVPVPGSPTFFSASIPGAAAGSLIEYRVAAAGASSGELLWPEAPRPALWARVGTARPGPRFNFQVPEGWTVENQPSLDDGAWDLGLPINCARGDPPLDAEGVGGSCFLTDNAPMFDCNTDVDGGFTRLVSPIIDLRTLPNPILSYARWYSNSAGSFPQSDSFVVEVSGDGGAAWVELETVGPGFDALHPEVDGGWINRSFEISRFVTPGAQFRLRFTASDTGDPSIVEAAVDTVSITGVVGGSSPPPCPGDVDGDRRVDFSDVIGVLSLWGTSGPAGDTNASGRVDFDDIIRVLSLWNTTCP